MVHQMNAATTTEKLSEENVVLRNEFTTLREKYLTLQQEITDIKSSKLYHQSAWLARGDRYQLS